LDCAPYETKPTASDAAQHNGGIVMGEKGKKDKGGKEKKKEPNMTLKEKRQAKKEKARNKSSAM
jgi:hypothetical protein